MSDELCASCRAVVPLNGYICEYCVHEELKRIAQLPGPERAPAVDDLDRRQYGYARTQQERMSHAELAMKRLRTKLAALGVPVQVDEKD